MENQNSTDQAPLFIGQYRIKALLKYDTLIPLMAASLKNFSNPDGGVVQPLRNWIRIKEHGGFLGTMPAYSSKENSLAVKIVSIYPENTVLPSHQGCITLFDPKNGQLLAIMDAEAITGIRTAAISAVAVQQLLHPDQLKEGVKSLTVAIVGSGLQAEMHVNAMLALGVFKEIRLGGRSPDKIKNLQDRLTTSVPAGITLTAAASIEEAVYTADVICTTTSSQSPVLQASWVNRGALVVCVGACRPDCQELDPELVRESELYVDSRESALKESGDVILSGATIRGELGELIGQKREDIARIDYNKVCVFKSLGIGVADASTARLVYDHCMSH